MRHGADIFNPLLKQVFMEWFTLSSHYDEWGGGWPSVPYVPMRRDDPEIFTRPQASWRRMYFQQLLAPNETTLVCYKTPHVNFPYEKYETMTFKNKFTMGQVYDYLEKLDLMQRGDDLLWVFFMDQGSWKPPFLGYNAEWVVQHLWLERQRWCEQHWGMTDNKKLSPEEREARKAWCKSNPRAARYYIKWSQRESLQKHSRIYRWPI
jgi:hypothetical protein